METSLGTVLFITVALTLAAVALVLAVAFGLQAIARELRVRRRDVLVTAMLSTFGPARARTRDDPRQLPVWYPLAAAARRLYPEAFGELDRAIGGRFPFSDDEVQAAHDRWTADWLAWERGHDFEYKLKLATIEQELERTGQVGTPLGKARLEAVEREQLERYQARYGDYVRVAKALAALSQPLDDPTSAR